MKNTKQSLLSHRYINGWSLFGLIALSISVSVAIPLAQIDTTNPAHISGMIALSVRLAVPWLDTSNQQFLPLALNRIVVGTLAGFGVFMIAYGNSWAPTTLGLLANVTFGGWVELFVPFLPIAPLYVAALAAGSPPG